MIKYDKNKVERFHKYILNEYYRVLQNLNLSLYIREKTNIKM